MNDRVSMLFFSFFQVYSISNQMFAYVSPHFHKDVILREREFDLGVFSILS